MAGKKDIVEQALRLIAGGDPQKTVKAYKLFKQREGKLYPLFVDANEEVPLNQWLKAKAGEQAASGQVKSKAGPLAYRPGWHAGDLPAATHIGAKSHGNKRLPPDTRRSDEVWAEVDMADDVDWQKVADERARITKKGTPDPKTAHITDQVPYGGFYRYKTSPTMQGNWMIGGDMRVNRVLTDDEVKAINEAAGVADLPRREGYGPGGWVDDVVKMAGKVISGEGEEATKAFRMPRVRPSTDNIHDVGSANFDYYDVVGNKTMPIKDVFGGVDLSMPDQRARVDALKAAMSDPEKGYISRIIVDDEGNVIEGQHRFDAFRELGASEIPVTMLRDKSRGIDVNAMRSVIQSQGGIHPDQAKQIVDMILEGNPEDYEPPQGFEKWWNAGVGEYNKQRGRIAKGGGGGFLDDALRMAGKAIFGEGEDAAKAGIRAYHASPHDFDKFEWSPRTSMTGEGAQSYGAGLYFAESPSVSGRGGTYDKQFTRKLQEIDRTGELGEKMGRVKIGGKPSTEYGIENDPGFIGAVKAGNVEKYARERLDRWHELSADEKYPYRDYATEKMRAWQKLLNDYSSGADVYYPMKARIYETNIAADPEKMMRWDEPLKDQPVEVMRGLGVLNSEDIAALQAEKRAIESKLQGGGWNDPIETQDPDEFWSKVNASVAKNSDDYSRLAKIERELSRAGKDIPDVTSGKFYKSSSERPENISLELRDRGVPGIQFWDGNSRGKSYLSQWRTDPLGNWTTDAFPSKGEATEYLSDVLRSAPALKGDERFSRVIQNPKATSNYVVFDDKLISIIRKYGIAGASAMLGYNLMEQLDPKQALAASMADQDYQSSRPQRSMGGNNSVSGALNVARGLHGGM